MLRPLLLALSIPCACSLFVPAANEGEGDAGEGEGDAGEGEGDASEGEGDAGEGEGDVGEGEGDVGEGEGDVGEGEGDVGEGEGDADAGCADGSAEGFRALAGLRACGGSWTAPGMHHDRSEVGSAESLCAEGWHVCLTAAEVDAELPDEVPCAPDAPGTFLTRQGTSGSGTCAPGGNDVIGCNRAPPNDPPVGCGPMNDIITAVQCTGDGPLEFRCDGAEPSVHNEAVLVAHPGTEGGVLCCRDELQGACTNLDDIPVDIEADTFVDEADASASPGLRSPLLIGARQHVLLRVNGNDLFFDPTVVDATLVLSVDPAATGRARVRPFTTLWTEFRGSCVGVTDCDGVADGASFAGPDPSQGIGDEQQPWPPGTFDGATVVGEAGFIAGTWRVQLTAELLRAALFVDDARPSVVGLIVDAVDSPATFVSREGATGARPVLHLNRCVDR